LKILILSNRVPFPLNDGGAMGIHYSLSGYVQAGCEVHYLAMNTVKHPVSEADQQRLFAGVKRFAALPVDNRVKPLDALLNLFSDKSYNIQRFENQAFDARLRQWLQDTQYDVVQFEGVYLAPYLETVRELSNAICVCRMHNVEYLIWERLAQQATNPAKKAYLSLLARRLKKYEQQMLNQFDELLPISEEDASLARTLGVETPMHLYPFGIDTAAVAVLPEVKVNPFSLYHIGSMDWMPNLEAIEWLLTHVWPLVHTAHPELELFLAGKHMPQSLLALNGRNGIQVPGMVPDALLFHLQHNLMLVPLRSGGGLRIKIMEALALGKTVISTSVGAEGIAVHNGEQVLIADTPEAFAEKISWCLAHPEAARTIGQNARKLMLEHYNKSKIIQENITRFKHLCTS